MKIAIINDVQMAVEALRRVITPIHEIAWVAKDGMEGVQKCQEQVPDLILMDLIMPVMDGVEATRTIMAENPCPILVVTSTVNGNMNKVFDAMNAGALDAVNTPVLESNADRENVQDLLDKIQSIGVLTRNQENAEKPVIFYEDPVKYINEKALIAIGSSTGGPSALLSILSTLPVNCPVPIIIVQHLDAQFSENLARWLNEHCAINVRVAKNNERLEPGTALLAGTNSHLTLGYNSKLIYVDEPKDNPYTPSVDVMFESIAKNWNGSALGVLLTGMGKDGALGMLAMKNKGWSTIAQNAESCVVYGMPKAAVELDAATNILPLDDIPGAIHEIFSHYKSQ